MSVDLCIVIIANTLQISHNLGHRLECIGKAVMAFREGKEKGKIDEKTLPFTLIGKVFKPKTQIGELFRCISYVFVLLHTFINHSIVRSREGSASILMQRGTMPQTVLFSRQI